MSEFDCPTCATDEHVTGQPRRDLITLTCSACGASWDRDPAPRCPTCGSADVEPIPRAAWEKSRGTQLSISYITTAYLCPDCDADRLRVQRQTNLPLPPDENPAAGMR